MKTLFYFILILFPIITHAQNAIFGRIVDQSGKPISGANVYLEGTYDGATTGEDGSFSFSTSKDGKQILVISYVSFETYKKEMPVSAMQDLVISLKEDVTALDAVVISAGTFAAGDNSKVSVLKPLDVVTTAGVAGDFIAALQTLPGTQTVGEDGRLFVRGGTAEETAVFIDGLSVFQPYTSSANNIPSRGRFSPFLFDGITFSTGGYSAEYGQALSSVLLLNTINEPDQTKTNISLMTVGAALGHTQKGENSSISLSANYINLAPYLELVPNNPNANFNEPYQNLAGEAVFRQQFQSGLLKAYSAYDQTNFEVVQPNVNSATPVTFNLRNNNLYNNISYKGRFGSFGIQPGISFSRSTNKIRIDENDLQNTENALNVKLKLSRKFNNHFKIDFGSEYLLQDFTEVYKADDSDEISLGYDSSILAAFAEGDYIFSKSLAVKLGLRTGYYKLSQKWEISPRFSMAYRVSEFGQVAFAYGNYSQQAQQEYLKYDHELEPEKSQHYILNYQLTKKGYTFKAEAFYKNYSDLLKYDTYRPVSTSEFSNTGNGYARGVDVFYRDNGSIKNLEYWISYSFIDSKRDFRNYPEKETPNFVAAHSASLVTKYWVQDWRSQLGFTYSFSTGRPYEDPNSTGFMNRKTSSYNNLSFNWAYLLSQQKILYFSISNVLNQKNVFGYEYAQDPDETGIFPRQSIGPAADRFFFVGFFWTISGDRKANQLDTL